MRTNILDDFFTSVQGLHPLRQTSLLHSSKLVRAGLVGAGPRVYEALHEHYMRNRPIWFTYPMRITVYDGVMYKPNELVIRALPWSLVPVELDRRLHI